MKYKGNSRASGKRTLTYLVAKVILFWSVSLHSWRSKNQNGRSGGGPSKLDPPGENGRLGMCTGLCGVSKLSKLQVLVYFTPLNGCSFRTVQRLSTQWAL